MPSEHIRSVVPASIRYDCRALYEYTCCADPVVLYRAQSIVGDRYLERNIGVDGYSNCCRPRAFEVRSLARLSNAEKKSGQTALMRARSKLVRGNEVEKVSMYI